jgi:hypothetical protein
MSEVTIGEVFIGVDGRTAVAKLPADVGASFDYYFVE